MTFEPVVATDFIITRIQGITALNSWKIEDVESDLPKYVLVSLTSPGQPDHVHGLTDGARVLGDPVVTVVVISDSKAEAVTLAKAIDENLESASGEIGGEFVQQVTRIVPVGPLAERSPAKNAKRYSAGAMYRVIVNSR